MSNGIQLFRHRRPLDVHRHHRRRRRTRATHRARRRRAPDASTSARCRSRMSRSCRREHRRQWRVPDRGRVRRDIVRRRCLQRDPVADHAGHAASRARAEPGTRDACRPTASAAIWSAATSTASAACCDVAEDARAQRWRFSAPPALLRIRRAGRDRSASMASASPSTRSTTTGFEVALIPHTIAHTAFAQTARRRCGEPRDRPGRALCRALLPSATAMISSREHATA